MYAEKTRLIRRFGAWIVISVYNIYFRLGYILKKNLTILRIIRTPDKEYKSRGSLGVRVNEVPLYFVKGTSLIETYLITSCNVWVKPERAHSHIRTGSRYKQMISHHLPIIRRFITRIIQTHFPEYR